MNVSFGGRVIGHEVVFEERCEYWIKPEIQHPQYVHVLPDEMYVGTETNTLEILSKYEQKKRDEGSDENKRDWWGQLSVEKKSKRPEKSMWNFMSNDVDDLIDEKIISVSKERDEIPYSQSAMEIERMNKRMIETQRKLAKLDGNDMRSYENIKELSISSTKQMIEFSLLIPSSITKLEINGDIPLNGISENEKTLFDIHPTELHLIHCQLPQQIPLTVKSLTIKQCLSQNINLSLEQLTQLESLHIQTYSKLNSIQLPSSLKELEVNGIPTVTNIEGNCSLRKIRINLCIKLNTIPLSNSIESIELNTCPQIVKLFNSLGYKPLFVKINNKVIK